MVGWKGKSIWADVDLFNLFDIDPHTADLTWAIVDEKSRKLIKKLSSGGLGVAPPSGVSVSLIQNFKSDLFDILYPFEAQGDENQRGDPTVESKKKLNDELKKINDAKLVGYQRTWDATNGTPGNWLGDADTEVESRSAARPLSLSSGRSAAHAAHTVRITK